MDNLHDILTNAELYDAEWLRQEQLCEAALEAESRVDPSSVSCNPLLIPSLLTRARLSQATRVSEERRLASLERKRLALRDKKPRDGRYTQWTQKQAKKRGRNKRQFNKTAGFGAILRARGYKLIDPALWAKYVTPIYEEYSSEYLTVVMYKHIPRERSRADGHEKRCYYGTKEYPYTVYTLRVEHSLLGTLYEGRDQQELDNKKAASEGGLVSGIETSPLG